MLLAGSIASNKTEILVEKYAQLLNRGVKSSEILVLVQNSTLKNSFIEKTLEKLEVEDCFEFISSLTVTSTFTLSLLCRCFPISWLCSFVCLLNNSNYNTKYVRATVIMGSNKRMTIIITPTVFPILIVTPTPILFGTQIRSSYIQKPHSFITSIFT